VRTIGLLRRLKHLAWARFLLAATLATALVAVTLPPVARALHQHAEEDDAYDSVYYTALLTGHDPHAAVVKAHYLTGTMMREFGMTQPQAAAYVARSMVWRSNGLCGD
jgi:hypothetical protein